MVEGGIHVVGLVFGLPARIEEKGGFASVSLRDLL